MKNLGIAQLKLKLQIKKGDKMAKAKDLIGQKFGRVLVVSKAKNRNGKVYWSCYCDCGKRFETLTSSLTCGKTTSCGCYRHEREIEANIKHGKRNTRIYRIYHGMKNRCYNSQIPKYKNYGGRGVKICDEWLGENGFINFYNWAIESGYDNTLTIERIDVNGNYCPKNCKWITEKEQAKNKTNNIYIEIDGRKKILSEWCKEFNIRYGLVHGRISKGWNAIDALTKQKSGLHEYKGRQLTLKEISEISGLSPKTIKSRLDKKWSMERIINEPYRMVKK